MFVVTAVAAAAVEQYTVRRRRCRNTWMSAKVNLFSSCTGDSLLVLFFFYSLPAKQAQTNSMFVARLIIILFN